MAGESGILVLAEHQAGQLIGLSKELLGAARRLADTIGQRVTAVSCGAGAADAAKEAIAHGADAALVAESADLDEYRNDAWTAAFTAAAREVNPAVVLMGPTALGRGLAPRGAIPAGTGAARRGRWVGARPASAGAPPPETAAPPCPRSRRCGRSRRSHWSRTRPARAR